jgi:hypothetical protein
MYLKLAGKETAIKFCCARLLYDIWNQYDEVSKLPGAP